MWEERELGNVEFIPEPLTIGSYPQQTQQPLDTKRDGEAKYWVGHQLQYLLSLGRSDYGSD